MDGGLTFARLTAALALSLSAHLLVVWALEASLGASGTALPGTFADEVLHVNVTGAEVMVAQASPTPPKGIAGTTAPRKAVRYVPASDLDVRPQVMTHVMPEYPKSLLSGIRGRVVLDLYISITGAMDRVQVVSAKPPQRFDQAAVDAFSKARFTPGRKNGKPVPSRLRIEVSFGD
jgi:protein TonB